MLKSTNMHMENTHSNINSNAMIRSTIAATIAFLSFHGLASAQIQPAQALAGRWKSDAQFIQKTESPTPEYFWVGPISGEVTATGKVTLSAANGCNISGLLSPVNPNNAIFNGAVNVTGCKQPSMNRAYTVDAVFISGNLKLIVSNKVISGGRVRATFDITTTLSRT